MIITLQKRVSYQPSPDGYAWVDIPLPEEWYSDDLEPLRKWLIENKSKYAGIVLRTTNNRFTFKFNGHHIEV